ncbi:hypothetical protein BC629DRAFT_1515125 [Irpex lacteus]|nr:hypothetical protein BC629DRAFT_1515125 [Irpex lacteus]
MILPLIHFNDRVSNGNVPTDGHSLGASYATLCYAELLRLQTNPPPRPHLTQATSASVTYIHTAAPASSQSSQSSSFRILTTSDPVPLVPPVLLTDPNFIHLDSAYHERGTHPRPPMLPVFDMSSHTPFAYFDALYWTASSRTAE